MIQTSTHPRTAHDWSKAVSRTLSPKAKQGLRSIVIKTAIVLVAIHLIARVVWMFTGPVFSVGNFLNYSVALRDAILTHLVGIVVVAAVMIVFGALSRHKRESDPAGYELATRPKKHLRH